MQGYVSGIEGTAVRGQTSGHYSQIGVDGDATNGNGEGIGVRARTKNGVGLFARSQGGYAIQVEGLAVFSRSGKLTFSAGQASRTVSGHSLIDGSIVVATIQGDVAGTWVRGVTVNANNDTFTIRLNKAAPKQLRVGWFIVN